MIQIKNPRILNTFAKQLNNVSPCENDCKETLKTPFVKPEELCGNCQSILSVITSRNLVPDEDAKLVKIATDITYKKFNPRMAFMLHVAAYNNIKSEGARESFKKAINDQL